MRRRSPISPRFSLALAAIAASLACTPNASPQPAACSPSPAFTLVVKQASGAALPADTRVKISYGGGAEAYALGKADMNQVVFCRPISLAHDAGAGDDAAGDGATADDAGIAFAPEVGQITCQLWTDGAADVTVDATGLASQKKTLEAKTNDCGVVTSLVEIDMRPPLADGGS